MLLSNFARSSILPRAFTSAATASFYKGAAATAVNARPGMLVATSFNNYKQSSSLQHYRHMHLVPREIDHLQLHHVGRLAQYRLARGTKLNHPEAIALITMQMMEKIRDGTHSVAELMSMGQSLLGSNQVQPGVSSLIPNVQVEGTFPDGTKLLTIHHPIAQPNGNMELAMEGSFLPAPDLSLFPANDDGDALAPGAILVDEESADSEIILNKGRPLIELAVTNSGDRPIQVGSHYAFVETNKALLFDRSVSIGKRLSVPSGASVRFEPGETKTVTLVDIGGTKNVVSGNLLTNGIASDDRVDEIMTRVTDGGFGHAVAATVPDGKAYTMTRAAYADTYGPTKGDRVVLGDTALVVRVEHDYTTYGEECKFGGGKTLREGMGQATGIHAHEALDCVIVNALIIDARVGIIKADVGIKGNKIVGLGKAGNPHMMDGVDANMIVGATTDVVAGEGMILTAGGVDTHVHYICPQQFDDAIASGVTTLFGGGTYCFI